MGGVPCTRTAFSLSRHSLRLVRGANSSSRAEGAGDCPDGCLSPGMLALGLVLMALFFVPVCVRFYRTRSCTDCSERRAKQMVANAGDP